MKKIISWALVAIMTLSGFAGCTDNGEKLDTKSTEFSLKSGNSELLVTLADGKPVIKSLSMTEKTSVINETAVEMPTYYEDILNLDIARHDANWEYLGAKTSKDKMTLKLVYEDKTAGIELSVCFAAYSNTEGAYGVWYECKNNTDSLKTCELPGNIAFSKDFNGEKFNYNEKRVTVEDGEVTLKKSKSYDYGWATSIDAYNHDCYKYSFNETSVDTVKTSQGTFVLFGGYQQRNVCVQNDTVAFTLETTVAEDYILLPAKSENSTELLCFTVTDKADDAAKEIALLWNSIKTVKKEYVDYEEKKEEKSFTLPNETLSITNLGDFTIVYPAEYLDWQMTEVNLLKATIEHIYGKTVDVIKDTEPEREHEIIFASSSRKTKLNDYVEYLDSRLSYVIGVAAGDIIIGGQDYYGDMRAAYTFINDYLGYNDIDNVYSTPKENISGTEAYIFEEPLFPMVCTNFYKTPFTEAWQVRDVADAHFNYMVFQSLSKGYATMEDFRDFCLLCTRFGIRMIINSGFNAETGVWSMRYFEAYEDNPIVWGHYLVDEPKVEYFKNCSDALTKYEKLYGQKGWKTFINLGGLEIDAVDEHPEYFANNALFSFDRYIADGRRYGTFAEGVFTENAFQFYKKVKDEADKRGKKCWSYIMAYYLDTYNTEKMLLWSEYINLCFGYTGILYFNYQTWIVDGNFKKLDYWYYAEEANEIIVELGEKLVSEYDYKGLSSFNVQVKDPIFGEDIKYDIKFKDVAQYELPEGDQSPYLVGCYEAKNNSNDLYVIVNTSALDDKTYAETTSEPIKLNFGKDATFYRDGVAFNAAKDADGYYSVEIGNGQSIVAIVEK